MGAVLVSLVAAGCWGVADFAGGLFSRTVPVAFVLLVIEAGGLLTAGAIVLVAGEPFPDTGSVVAAGVAGLVGVAALGAFYRGLAVGTMSVVAPIAATGAVIPVIAGIAGGDRLGLLTALGLVAALVGIVLTSREEDDGEVAGHALSVAFGLVAAVGFGLFFVLYHRATEGGIAWAILLTRAPAAPVVGAAVLLTGARPPAGTRLGRLLACAQLDCCATSLYAVAVQRGPLSVVAVVGSLYPVVTVLLARGVLGERLARVQAVGVVAALVGVALVSAGSA